MTAAYKRIRQAGWISAGLSIEGHDQFATAFNNVERYLRYLDVIRGRVIESYERTRALSDAMRVEMPHVEGAFEVTPNYSALLYESQGLAPIIQLDIESFYLNARILLDRLWKFIHFCFCGNDDLTPKALTTFRNGFDAFAATKKLKYEASLLTDAAELGRRVKQIRDKQVIHNDDIRTMIATMSLPTPGSMPQLQFANHKDGMWIYSAATEDPNKLFDDLYAYVDCALRLIDNNKDSLCFKFQAEGYDERLQAASRPISKAKFSTVTVGQTNSKGD